MPNYVFCHQDPDFYVRLITFCPHRIKPPDSLLQALSSRFCGWLSVILLFLIVCPRVGAESWSIFDSFAREFAEQWLKQATEFPRELEGFELAFVSQGGLEPLSVIYNITPNNDSWLFITPCSHSKYAIGIQSVASERDPEIIKDRTSYINEGNTTEWYKKITEIDMKFSSGLGEKIVVTNWKRQEMYVKNLKLGIMKIFITRFDPLPSVFMIRQYSGRIDAFYPRIPPNPTVRVCKTDGTSFSSQKLSIFVSRAFNTDLYCVNFNLEEDLPNFCTAQLRIDKTLFRQQKKRENVNFRRPDMFDDVYKNKILKTELRCFKTNKFDVSLKNLFTKTDMYINIYAVNTATEFTDSYHPVIYKWGKNRPECNSGSRRIIIDKDRSHIWLMGNETVFFNITSELEHRRPMRLLYQGCVLKHREYIQLFKGESQRPLCVGIVESRMMSLCHPLKAGVYRFEHIIEGRNNNSKPVGQIILSSNIRAFPHLYCDKSEVYSLKVDQIISKSLKDHYHIKVNFSRISGPQSISYYFHILEFPILKNENHSIEFLMSRTRQEILSQRNFCNFFLDQSKMKIPIHQVILDGKGCESTEEKIYEATLPGMFSKNNTYAVFVHFSTESTWMPNDAQFYSNLIFTMTSEEEVF